MSSWGPNTKIWWIPAFPDYNETAMRLTSSLHDLDNTAFRAQQEEIRAVEARYDAILKEIERVRLLVCDSMQDGTFAERLERGEFELPEIGEETDDNE